MSGAAGARRQSLTVLTEGLGDATADMELTGAILRSVAAGTDGATIRIFRPSPTVAFGRLDRLRPGFDTAWAIGSERGYTPVLRHGGGHAVIYDGGSLLVEWIRPEEHVTGGLERRFVDLSDLLREALAGLGIRTETGELEGEYCPGRFSLHLHGGPKVAGIAQRVIKGASLTTAVLTVTGEDRIRMLAAEIYAALALPMEPATVGGLTDFSASPDQVATAIRRLLTGSRFAE